MKCRKFPIATSLAAILMFGSGASADPLSFYDTNTSNNSSSPRSAFYVGGSLGSMSADDFCNGCDDSDMGWKIFGGYDYSDLISLELGYNSLGKVKSPGANSEISGLSAAALGKFKVNEKIGLFGKAGVFKWTADNSDGERDATDLMMGAGASYDYSDNIKLRGEWERFMDVETSTTGRSDIDFLSAGFSYQTL